MKNVSTLQFTSKDIQAEAHMRWSGNDTAHCSKHSIQSFGSARVFFHNAGATHRVTRQVGGCRAGLLLRSHLPGRTPLSPERCTHDPGAAVQLCPSLSPLLDRHVHHWPANLPVAHNPLLVHGPPALERRWRSRRAWSIPPQEDWGNILQMQKRSWIFTCSCGLVSGTNGLCDNLFLSLSPKQGWQSQLCKTERNTKKYAYLCLHLVLWNELG